MNKEILDSEFYEKKELPARDWWENKRKKLNTFCLISIAIMFFITVLFFINDNSTFILLLISCVFYALIFFTITNIAYSGIWVLEETFKKLFKIDSIKESRNVIYKSTIFLLFSPNILYLLLMIIIKYPFR